MAQIENPKEFFITTTMATGNANFSEAAMMLRFSGYNPVVLKNDNKERISLHNAIKWNISEISTSDGLEKQYRQAMVKELAGMIYADLPMSEETLVLQAKVFPEQAKAFYKAEKNNLPSSAINILKKAGVI